MLVDYTNPSVSTFALAGDCFHQFGAKSPCLLRETDLFDTLYSKLADVLTETRDGAIHAERVAMRLPEK